MKRRPSSRLKMQAAPATVVNKKNVSEWARAYTDGELSTGEREAVDVQLDRNPSLRRAFDRRCNVLGMVAGSLGAMEISKDYDDQAHRRLSERDRIRAEREEQGLDSTSKALSGVGLGVDPDADEEEYFETAPAGFLDSLSQHFGAAPWWLISGAFHALILLLVTLIGMAIIRAQDNETVIVTDLEQRKEPEKLEEPIKRDIIPKPQTVVDEEIQTDQTPIVTHEEVEIADHVETPDDSDAADTRGEDGISDVFLGGSGTVAALGLGGGGGGAFGRPGGKGGRLRRAIRGGGGRATESAVDAALAWLARNQEADGRWDTKKHGGKEVDPGVTALALLAFLGAGHTEKIGKYRGNVQKAVQWIISKQEANGSIGKGYKEYWHPGYAYHHSMCGLALAEAAAMAKIPATVEAAKKALEYTTEIHQGGDGSQKKAWRYNPKKDADASVSGWFVMQLKSAKVAGLPVNPASFEGALSFYDSIEIKNGSGQYKGGEFPYKKGGGTALNTTAIGILCNLFLGRKPGELMGGAEYLLKNLPSWDAKLGQGGVKKNSYWPMYYTYYSTLTMFQMGGHYWQGWNKAMKQMLLPNQCKGGDNDGSWDPLGGDGDKFGGRVYMTAMGALCLEVYYRYLPITR